MSDDTTNKPPRNALVETFAMPREQALLDGKVGLTNYDIAQSLGIDVRAVNQKLDRGRFLELCKAMKFKMITHMIPNDSGHPRRVIALETRAACAFVAKWDNETGWGYLNHLLSCEIAATSAAREIQRLRADVAALTAPKQRRLPGHGLVTFIKRVIRETDMFGDTTTGVVTDRKSLATMTDDEKRAYATQHRAKTIRGLSEAQDCEINYIGFPRLPN